MNIEEILDASELVSIEVAVRYADPACFESEEERQKILEKVHNTYEADLKFFTEFI